MAAATLSVAGALMILYHTGVRFENYSLFSFFLLSLAAHLALLPLLWRKPSFVRASLEPISVSFLPPQKNSEPDKIVTAPPLPPSASARKPAAKPPKRAAVPERKRPAAVRTRREPVSPPAPQPPAQPKTTPAGAEPPAVIETKPLYETAKVPPEPNVSAPSILRQERPAKPVTRDQLVPNIRDLVSYNKPIPLNTRDPVLAPFTKVIESWIEAQWQYPDLAKHYGLQGKVTLEFTVLDNGRIDLLSVVRSSGSHLLDQEAVRAVKAAAPFPPIPKSVGASRLRIIAGFTYLNNRVALTNQP